ncbi:helix-turn-helix domain-containing protein [Streptomyces sp. NPDC048623]|uniref:helix-turn-helix domain-containing protein n=1 Tax=Streptomyces sp. NPDC048623 TaxID=3155761 RepID=UPI0034377D21
MKAGNTKIAPGTVDAQSAERALRGIRDYLAHNKDTTADITILGEVGSDDPLVLPRPTVEMFAAMLAALANGQGVQVMPVNAIVSTQVAADMLNVSRPHLVGLLEKGDIPFERVGRHRRIKFNDVMEYKRRDDRERPNGPSRSSTRWRLHSAATTSATTRSVRSCGAA